MFPDLNCSLRLDARWRLNRPPMPTGRAADQADAHSLTPLLGIRWGGEGWLRMLPESGGRMAKAFGDNARRRLTCAPSAEIDRSHRGRVPIVLKAGCGERLYADPARVMYDHDFCFRRGGAGRARGAEAVGSLVPVKDACGKAFARAVAQRWLYVDGYLFDPDYPRPVELHVHCGTRAGAGCKPVA